MADRKNPPHFPNALAVLGSKCRPTWVLDYFKDLTDRLESVAYQRRFEIASVNHYFLGRKFWKCRFCGERLVAIKPSQRAANQESVGRGHSITWWQPATGCVRPFRL